MTKTTPALQPVPPEAPLPHRKTLRQWLIPLSTRVTARAIALLVLDYALLLSALAGTVLLDALWAKLLCGVAAGFVIGRLFIMGHDACHQSLTPTASSTSGWGASPSCRRSRPTACGTWATTWCTTATPT